MLRGSLLFALVVGAAGCGVASSDDATASELASTAREGRAVASTPAGLFTITLGTVAPELGLGEKLDVDVTVTPSEGFSGDVNLAIEGLSKGATAAPVTVSLASGPVTTKLTIATEHTANVTPKDASVPVHVVATARKERAEAAASFKVLPRLTLFIPKDIAALYNAPGGPLRAEWGAAFGPNNQPLRTQPGNPIALAIFNSDTMAHVIHGNGGAFPHGDLNKPIEPNAFESKNGVVRTRLLDVGTNTTGYVHGEPNSTNASFKIVVAAAQ